MSHVARVEVEVRSLEDLKEACHRMGFHFMENKKTYQWYGRFVGDQPLPEGITVEDLGRCDHAIRIDGCRYEIGIVRRNGHYILLWDSWYRGGLEEKLGQGAGLLKQAYAVEKVKREAKLKGYRITEKRVEDRIRLVLTA